MKITWFSSFFATVHRRFSRARQVHAVGAIIVSLGIPFAAFAGAVERTAPNYQPIGNELAVAFLRRAANTDNDLPAFLKEQQAEAGKLKAAVDAAVAVGRQLIADGVAADSRHFGRLLADTTGIGSAASTGTGTRDTGPAVPQSAAIQPTAAQIETGKQRLWRAGLDRLNLLSLGEQARFAAFNKVNPDELATAFSQTKPPTPGSSTKVDEFLIAVGYEQRRAAARIAGTSLPAEETTASLQGFGGVRTPPALATDAWLRNNGLSFATGLGIAHRAGADRPVGTLIARWNVWQRIATAKWNQRIGDNNPEGYAQVPFWGAVEYYDRSKEGIKNRIVSVRAPAQTLPVLPEMSFLGPFLGRAMLGEKIITKGDEERPYVIGTSIGFGFYREAAPFVTFDAGKTISPKHGLKGSSNYFGVSFDALVLSSITGFMKGPTPAASPSPASGGSQ